MLRLDHNQCTFRLHIFHQCICNLSGQLFLQLKSSCEYFYRSCQLAQSHYLSIRNIRNMSFSIKREQMMFAGRIKSDILFDDHFPAFYCKCLRQMNPRIFFHSAINLFIHPCDPIRCLQQTFPVHIFPDSFQQQSYRLLYLFMIYHFSSFPVPLVRVP